jgi:hypothetical protein
LTVDRSADKYGLAGTPIAARGRRGAEYQKRPHAFPCTDTYVIANYVDCAKNSREWLWMARGRSRTRWEHRDVIGPRRHCPLFPKTEKKKKGTKRPLLIYELVMASTFYKSKRWMPSASNHIYMEYISGICTRNMYTEHVHEI